MIITIHYVLAAFLLYCLCFRFIQRPMQYRFNNHNFKLLYLNTIFNSERVVLENFYEAMVYVAFKFEAVVNVRFECIGKIKESIVLKQLQQIVYYYSFKSNLLLNKAKGSYLLCSFLMVQLLNKLMFSRRIQR